MASKLVTDRQKGADAVAAVGQTQASELAAAISQTLGTEEAADTEALTRMITRLSERLLGARNKMVSADNDHERELADDPAARDARDLNARHLSERLIELRQVLTGLYGVDIARRVLGSQVPNDPVVVARFAVEVGDRLSNVQLPTSRVAGAQLDVTVLRDELVQMAKDLESKIAAVASEVREAQVTLANKHQAMTDYDRVFSAVATIMTGFLELVDQRDLAAKVRPSTRRPGRTVDDEDSAPAAK